MTLENAIPTPTIVPNRRPLRIGEFLLVVIGLTALMAGEIALSKPKMLFDGPFSLDECLTDFIVRDPNFGHSIQAVRHGVDTNPPVFHLLERAFWTLGHPLFHDSPRVTLRAFSALCIWLALLGTFIILRRGFSPVTALLGVLAVWAHPDVLEQSDNARFYGPLLLAVVATCLFLGMPGRGIIRGLLVGVSAIFLCTLHYFGIVMLAPLGLAMLLIDAAPLGQRILRVLPTIAGPIALVPFISFIRTQAEGLSVKTWVDPFSFHLAREFLELVLCPLGLCIAVSLWAISQLKPRTVSGMDSFDRQRLLACAPLMSIIIVPLALVVFSAVVQSALITRYAIAASLVFAPVAAMLAENRSRSFCFLLALLLSALTILQLHSLAKVRTIDLQIFTNQRDELLADQLPMAFADRADATRLMVFSPNLLSRIFLIDQREPGVDLIDFRKYETDMVGKFSAFYPLPAMIPAQKLSEMGKFHLIAQPPDMANLLLEVPMRHITGDVYEAIK